jgi:hypothetical protein
MAGAADRRDRAIDGFHVARVSDSQLVFVVVCDIDEKDLAAAVDCFAQRAAEGVTSGR